MSPLIYLLAGLATLVILTLKKVNPFLALIVAAFVTAMVAGLDINDCLTSIEKGVGQTLGSTLLILTLGGAYGSMLEKSGAIQAVTKGMLFTWGVSKIQWTIMVISFLVGLPLFYNAAFILLFPLVSGLIQQTGLPARFLALPMVAALSITHALTPPHPAPSALATMLHANIAQTLIWGLCIALPAAVVGGPLLSSFFKKEKATETQPPAIDQDQGPGRKLSLMMAVLPIVLITMGSLENKLTFAPLKVIFTLFSLPTTAMLISLLIAAWFLGIKRNHALSEIMQWLTKGMEGIFNILLIIAAGGAFKEVLVITGVADTLTNMAGAWAIHPLLFGWMLAAMIRVAIGSATVAALTAAGLMAPGLVQMNVSPELMVLSIGSGSIFFSHLNDAGFWMFKEFFQLTIKETFLSWTLMESCISLMGLAGVWIIYMFAA
jgi:gluconate transporter